MLKAIIVTLVTLTATATYAGDCQKLWPHLEEARENLVLAFKKGDSEQMSREAENLVFWDAYIQVECSRGNVVDTPIVWLAKKGKKNSSAYLAGYMFWMQDLQEIDGLDITPAGLVSGRSFE
jgi:hypothetical protein